MDSYFESRGVRKDFNCSNKCHYEKYALEELVEQIKYSTNNELVSSDIVGTSALQFMTVMPQSFLMTVKYSVIHL
jgi:hypothetical protein